MTSDNKLSDEAKVLRKFADFLGQHVDEYREMIEVIKENDRR